MFYPLAARRLGIPFAALLLPTLLCFLPVSLPQPVAAQGYYIPPSQFPSIPRNGNPSSNYHSTDNSDPQAAQAKYAEGNRLLNAGHPEEAIPLLKEALSLDYRSANAYNDLGAAYMDLKQYSAATADLHQAIYYNPRLEIAYRNMGVICDQTNAAAAEPWYTKALQLNPKDVKAWSGRGYDYAVMDMPAKAFYDYKTALHLNPSFARAYHWRGKLELQLGQDKVAYADLKKSRSLDPGESNGIAKDVRAILAQRQSRLAEQQAARRPHLDA